MANYNVEEAIRNLEDYLTDQIINNLKTAGPEGLESNQALWKTNQLKALEEMRKNNREYFKNNGKDNLKRIEEAITKQYAGGRNRAEKQILEALNKKLGKAPRKNRKNFNMDITGMFNGVNERKLKAIIKEVQKTTLDTTQAIFRFSEDKYNKIIYDSVAAYNTGGITGAQAIDMATRNLLENGIDCIEIRGEKTGKDGRKHPYVYKRDAKTYSEMVIRTAEKRAYLQGEASMRDEWGIGEVIVTHRGTACPHCAQFLGKVLWDDVYGDVPVSQNKSHRQLLSDAMAAGLYHPNCKDGHTTYFEGITPDYGTMTPEELQESTEIYNLQQQQRYNERQIRKYKRLENGQLDEANKARYHEKVKEWQARQRQLIKDNDGILKRDYTREQPMPTEAQMAVIRKSLEIDTSKMEWKDLVTKPDGTKWKTSDFKKPEYAAQYNAIRQKGWEEYLRLEEAISGDEIKYWSIGYEDKTGKHELLIDFRKITPDMLDVQASSRGKPQIMLRGDSKTIERLKKIDGAVINNIDEKYFEDARKFYESKGARSSKYVAEQKKKMAKDLGIDDKPENREKIKKEWAKRKKDYDVPGDTYDNGWLYETAIAYRDGFVPTGRENISGILAPDIGNKQLKGLFTSNGAQIKEISKDGMYPSIDKKIKKLFGSDTAGYNEYLKSNVLPESIKKELKKDSAERFKEKSKKAIKTNRELSKIKDENVRKQVNEYIDSFSKKYDVNFDDITIRCDGRIGSNAETRVPLKNGVLYTDKSEIVLSTNKNFASFEAPESLIKLNRQAAADKGFHIRVDEGNEVKKTVSHEFGHSIQRSLVNEGKLTTKTAKEEYYKKYAKLQKEMQEELCERYEKRTGEKMTDKMSKYGLSTPGEFFAEAFASYELNTACLWREEIDYILRKYKILK